MDVKMILKEDTVSFGNRTWSLSVFEEESEAFKNTPKEHDDYLLITKDAKVMTKVNNMKDILNAFFCIVDAYRAKTRIGAILNVDNVIELGKYPSFLKTDIRSNVIKLDLDLNTEFTSKLTVLNGAPPGKFMINIKFECSYDNIGRCKDFTYVDGYMYDKSEVCSLFLTYLSGETIEMPAVTDLEWKNGELTVYTKTSITKFKESVE